MHFSSCLSFNPSHRTALIAVLPIVGRMRAAAADAAAIAEAIANANTDTNANSDANANANDNANAAAVCNVEHSTARVGVIR